MKTAALFVAALAAMAPLRAEINELQKLAPDVFFHEGDLRGKGHCNNGWIVFEEYVLVVDANFPSGAQEIIPKIKELTSKPVRFAFDTHHHGDHAYGNQVWVEQGATPVAHTGVVEEMKKYEPGRWNDTAKTRKDVQNSKLKFPSVLFPSEMFFDDGNHRVELHHFGVAHTRGDAFAWLPKERILFTGDACVNGPYNYVGDGSISDWINTLEAARKLNPAVVCPGHGPSGDSTLLEHQQEYFRQLLAQAKNLKDKKPTEIKATVEDVKTELKKNPAISKYVGDGFAAQLEKAVVELGGKQFLSDNARSKEERKHIHSHGHDLAHTATTLPGKR